MSNTSRVWIHSSCLVCVFIISVSLQACGGGGGDTGGPALPPQVQSIDVPPETGDGWQTASLADVGIATQPMLDALNAIRRGNFNEIHGLVVVKDSLLVLEDYGSGRMYDRDSASSFTPVMHFNRDTLHIVHSVSKAFMSTLVGLAIANGYIIDENQSVLSFFPEHQGVYGQEKNGIQLRHLMTMTSGLQWNEWDVPAMDWQNNDAIRYQTASDPSAYFFGKPLIHEPGASFYYNTAGFQMAGEVLRRSTAMSLDQFAAQHLFTPLGITNFEWEQYEHGTMYLVGDIFLRPRDMAKFGQLLLNGGAWDGQQVVPAEWLQNATSSHVSVAHTGYKGYEAYGFHWWLKSFAVGGQRIPAICADGFAGQSIMVFPSLDLVVVVTGGNYDRPELEHGLVANYILPAVLH